VGINLQLQYLLFYVIGVSVYVVKSINRTPNYYLAIVARAIENYVFSIGNSIEESLKFIAA